MSDETGLTVAPTDVWRYPTPSTLAGYLAGASAPASEANPGPRQDEPVAIIGMSCRFPGAPGVAAFWRLLSSGADAITERPAGRQGAERGGFLESIDEFDPDFFGISPREAVHVDPQQRLMLELAWESLEDAGVPVSGLGGSRTCVFAGAMWSDYGAGIRADPELVGQHTLAGGDPSVIPGRISYTFGLRGPSMQVNTACSSSLVAVHLAAGSLRAGECDLALAGGVSLMIGAETPIALSRLGALAPDGRSKAFDARADGYGRGEGGGMVVLKPLSRALADGDRIYCVLTGSAVNHDGFSNGLTAPNGTAQESVLREAYQRAGVDAADVQYVEAHGTGTELGDPIEAHALSSVLCADRPAQRPLVIGSVKSAIGHLEPAAGIAGLIKVGLAIRNRAIPPCGQFTEPNPHIHLDDWGLRVPRLLTGWPAGASRLVAGVSSFGFSGTNCHVVVESAGATHPRAPDAQAGTQRSPVTFVFGGQGAQWGAMGERLMRAEPAFRKAIARCEAAMRPHVDWSLSRLLTSADDGWLDRTDQVQPAIFAMQVALSELWRARGVEPDAVVGMSMGEVAAAYVAGALTLDDAATIICRRSAIAAGLRGRGRMAVAELSAADVAELVAGRGDRLWVAGEAGPESTVLSGDRGAIGDVLDELTARSVRCGLIAVDYASHCPYVDEVLPAMRAAFAGIRPRPGRIPFYSAATGDRADGAALDAGHWVRTERDRWRLSAVIARLLAGDTSAVFVDVDPHPVLQVAIEQHDATAVASLHRGDQDSTMHDSLNELRARGAVATRIPPPDEPELLVISGRSAAASTASASALADLLDAAPDTDPGTTLHDVCYTAAVRRDHHEHRLAVVASSGAELAASLRATAKGARPGAVRVGTVPTGARPSLAFVYPGQGSQWAGMGRTLLRDEPVFRDAVQRCAELLDPLTGWSLLDELSAVDGNSRLADTAIAQPALFAVQLGLTRLWRHWGIVPDALIGHSVGEVTAAHVAGVLSLDEAIRVVYQRGRLMARADRAGGMASVELPVERVQPMLAGYALDVAAVNDPDSTVVSGDRAALDRFLAGLRSDGIVFRELRVEYAFHSAHMDPAVRELSSVLEVDPGSSELPFYSTVSGGRADDMRFDTAYWAANMRRPVRFADAMRDAVADGHRVFLDIGPHPVLAENVERCLAGAPDGGHAIASLRREAHERAALLEAAGALHVHGRSPDFERVVGGGRVTSLPAYPWQRRRYWLAADVVEAGPVAGAPDPFGDLVYTIEWRRQDGPDPGEPGSWIVFGGTSEPGARLAGELRARGGRCVLVTDDPAGRMDAAAVLAAFDGVEPDGIVLLGDRGPDPSVVVDAVVRRGWRDPPRLWQVTTATQPAGAQRPVVAVGGASSWGTTRALGLRHPELRCTRVDVDTMDDVTSLVAELLGGDRETDIALRQDGRYVARLVPATGLAEHTPVLRADGAYLVVAADEAVAESFTGWLSERGARNIVVEPEVGSAARITGIERENGQLRGIVHAGAGDAWPLHEYTMDRDVDLFVTCSSVASVFGNGVDAADGARADALAAHRRDLGLPAVSLHIAADDSAAQGIAPLPAEEAGQALDRVLGTGLGQALALRLSVRHWYESFPGAANGPLLDEISDGAPDDTAFTGRLAAAAPADRAAIVEEHLVEQLSLTLHRDSAGELDRSMTFRDMGLGSLMAVELRNRLESTLGVRLSVALLFTYSTIAALAGYVLAQLGQDPADTGVAQTPEQPAELPHQAGLLAERVDQLSDTEAEAMLLESIRLVEQDARDD